MRRVRLALAALAALALAAAAAAAVRSALADDVIKACRSKSTGVLRVPAPGYGCKTDETVLEWNTRGPAGPTGPTGPAGPASVTALAGSACTTAAGSWGTIAVTTASDGLVSFRCRAATDPEAVPALVLNEVDYDGPTSDGFVELFNAGRGTADLGGLALYLVDGATGTPYESVALGGAVLAEQFHLVQLDLEDGPDAVALVDTVDGRLIDSLWYEGSARAATISGRTYDLVAGTALPASVADPSTAPGSLVRLPDGADGGDDADDWSLSATPTPGNPNFP